MRACAAALVAAGLAGLTLAGCELDRGAGYVELKTLALGAGPILVLDTARLDPLRKGQAVLRAKVGSHKLQVEGPGGMLVFLCEFEVKKDRITTITILDRPPRCQCRNAAGTDPPANRTCVS
jgi:hypothetical protein